MQGVLNCGPLPLLFLILRFIFKYPAMIHASLKSLYNVYVTQIAHFISKIMNI